MKTFISIILLLTANGVDSQNTPDSIERFTADFNLVADTYEKAIEPYLIKFATLQVEPFPQNISPLELKIRNREVMSMVDIHKIYVKEVRKQGYDLLLKSDGQTYKDGSVKKIISYFDFGYKTRFLFLDYEFYEKTNKQLQSLK